jgi:pyruvate carboxylase subunit B
VEIHAEQDGLHVVVDGVDHPVDVAQVEDGGLLSLLIDGKSHAYAARFENGTAVLSFHDREVHVGIEDERTRMARLATGGGRAASGKADVKSVMPGVVKEIRVQAGDTVQSGQPLLILEAMKMENEIRAPLDGVVANVHVAEGEAVEKGSPLIDLVASEEANAAAGAP